jgi:hypothetical protein
VVPLHEEDLEAADRAVAQQDDGRGRRGHDRLFDGHDVV